MFTINYKVDGSIERYKTRLWQRDIHKPMELTTKKLLH